jgi:hypothetical protein
MASMGEAVNLSLSEAIRAGRLGDFIAQEEARGVGMADRDDLDRALRMVSMPTDGAEACPPDRKGSRQTDA